MKKKNVILSLLFFAAVASMNAQVTIGSSENPTEGAILDLSISGNLGLILPRVALNNTTHYQLGTQATQDSTSYLKGAGTVVYNDGKGALKDTGVYVWDGSKWLSVTSNTIPLLTSFDLGNLTNNKLLLTAGGASGTVNATNFVWSDGKTHTPPTITWSLESGEEGDANITKNSNDYVVTPGTDYTKWTIKASSGEVQREFKVLVGDQCYLQDFDNQNDCEQVGSINIDRGSCQWQLKNGRVACVYKAPNDGTGEIGETDGTDGTDGTEVECSDYLEAAACKKNGCKWSAGACVMPPFGASQRLDIIDGAGTFGSIAGSSTPNGNYSSGTLITATATPNLDYSFDNWYANGVRIEDANAAFATYTLPMPDSNLLLQPNIIGSQETCELTGGAWILPGTCLANGKTILMSITYEPDCLEIGGVWGGQCLKPQASDMDNQADCEAMKYRWITASAQCVNADRFCQDIPDKDFCPGLAIGAGCKWAAAGGCVPRECSDLPKDECSAETPIGNGCKWNKDAGVCENRP
ncbi:hypothetical protein FACS189413_18010 [Bacteroidia bacterium]|nr:hypothetical protein FACS189413_18010 [Bacteroidia bacterium]